MSSIEFEEPLMNFRTIDISEAVTRNTPLLVKLRIVKSLKAANTFMIISLVILLAAAITIYQLRPSAAEKKYKEDYTLTELSNMLPDTVERLPTRPE